VFFVSFTILVTMLIMNLSVAAVIEGLDTAKRENLGIVQGAEIELLINLWQDYDPSASGFITMTDLVFLLYELPPPLGKRSSKCHTDSSQLGTSDPRHFSSTLRAEDRFLVNLEKGIIIKKVNALDLLKGLNIKIHQNNQVHFVDVFKALIKRIFMEMKMEYHLQGGLN